MVNAQLFLAQIINLERRYDEASKLYDQIDVWTAKWEPSRREAISGGLARVSIMLTQGNYDNALEIAQRTFDRERGDPATRASTPRSHAAICAIALARNSKTDGIAAGLQGIDPGPVDGLGRQRRRRRIDGRRARGSRPLRGRRLFARAGAQSGAGSGERRRRNLRLCRRAARAVGSARAAGLLGALGNRQAGTGQAGPRVAGRRKADRRRHCHA